MALKDYLFYEEPGITLYCGDALAVLRQVPDASVHCVVTSPPYWGLRDYGLPPLVWDDPGGCEHEWGEEVTGRSQSGSLEGSTLDGAPPGPERRPQWTSAFCSGCSAWRGSFGLEPTPGLYVQHLVEIFREVRRVLRDDGTVWLNLGDSYASIGRSERKESPGVGATQAMGKIPRDIHWQAGGGHNFSWSIPAFGTFLKPKDLIGIPWRVAFALQADGWRLRSDIIWAKPNPMPESVTDRPTKSHEYLFLLSKSATYYYDAEAIKEPLAPSGSQRVNQTTFYEQQGGDKDYGVAGVNTNRSARKALENFAKYKRLPAGWNSKHEQSNLIGRYDNAEAPITREFRDKTKDTPHAGGRRQAPEPGEPNAFSVLSDGRLGRNRRTVWEIATEPFPEAHFATFPTALVKPCIAAGSPTNGMMLDPFVGAGTAVFVAKELGRRSIGIDLNETYLAMAVKRLRQEVLQFP